MMGEEDIINENDCIYNSTSKCISESAVVLSISYEDFIARIKHHSVWQKLVDQSNSKIQKY